MSIAAILQEYGFVPKVPASPRRAGTPESVAYQRVPKVPKVPAQISKIDTRMEGVPQKRRAVIRFRNGGDGWATALGAPGMTAAALLADLRQRWPGVEVQAHDCPAPSASFSGEAAEKFTP